MGSKSSKPSIDDASKVHVAGDAALQKQDAPPATSEASNDEPQTSGGCPMKRSDGSYSYSLGALFGAKKHPHGPKGSIPLEPQKEESSSTGGCPVQHDAKQPTTSDGCPVKRDQQQQQYNVYSQPINPKNQMPNLNQLPSPQQKESLSTDRIQSNIPKGGANEGTTWTYPSPQMFYNALARKGKLEETEEDDMDSVVALHNNMNEKTWQKVCQWESVIGNEKETPKLLKFMGRPSDLSPKALFKHHILGHPLPFDRHDWTILRKDGTTVRYVIDYYYDETRASEHPDSAMPHMDNAEATPSLLVDVRPALDGPSAVLARCVQMPRARRLDSSTDFEPMPMLPTSEMKSQVTDSVKVWDNIQKAKLGNNKNDTEQEDSDVSKEEAMELAQSFASILRDCQSAQDKIQNATSEEEATRASMDLRMCMAKIVCPLQHGALVEATRSSTDVEVEAALENMSLCVAAANQRTVLAKRAYPKVFEGIDQ